MKHLAPKRRGYRRKKPMWLLYGLATVAIVFAVLALYKTLSTPEEGDSLPSSGLSSGPDTAAPTTQPPDPDEVARQQAADRQTLLDECEIMLRGYYYDEVISKLNRAGELKNEETEAMLARAQELKGQLVLYSEEQLYHVFFHSLIVDNEKAFDGYQKSPSDGAYKQAVGYNNYMTTRNEFNAMLPLFLENGFILYDITEIYEYRDGKYVRKDIYLPAGKKPLIISIDDVNYYEYMAEDGFATRLDVDNEGNVVTIVKDENGVERATYDGDVMPILDAFVREHPEFSWKGAKGVVAITGYQGAFGYRIQKPENNDPADQKAWTDKVGLVANALRSTGWKIACHSFTHNNLGARPLEDTEYDLMRWNEAIAPYVGKTDLYISPYGFNLTADDPRFRAILDDGFVMYCPVGSSMVTWYRDDYILQERLNLDGLTMLKYPQRVSKHFFDPALVLDPDRPPLD